MHEQMHSEASTGVSAPPVPVHAEDAARADTYRLLASTLLRPPTHDVLNALSQLEGDTGSEFGAAIREMASRAAAMPPESVTREFHQLFIGLGRGELVPYASFYLTGFLHEKPLAKLRNDLSAMGIDRAPDVHEPEDHIGTLCEVMQGLIMGSFGPPASIAEQKRFFLAHIEAWAKHFFTDLETAESASFYAPVGQLGRLFMEIEHTAFQMEG